LHHFFGFFCEFENFFSDLEKSACEDSIPKLCCAIVVPCVWRGYLSNNFFFNIPVFTIDLFGDFYYLPCKKTEENRSSEYDALFHQ
jgi:hypothetical protein